MYTVIEYFRLGSPYQIMHLMNIWRKESSKSSSFFILVLFRRIGVLIVKKKRI